MMSLNDDDLTEIVNKIDLEIIWKDCTQFLIPNYMTE